MAYNVLVCSTRKEQDLAKDLVERLRNLGGLAVQRETPAGAPLSKARHARLEKADEFIVLLTDKSIEEPWILYEMGAASSLHKRVTPILIGIGDSDLPSILRQMPHVSYADVTGYLAKLKKRAATGEEQHRIDKLPIFKRQQRPVKTWFEKAGSGKNPEEVGKSAKLA